MTDAVFKAGFEDFFGIIIFLVVIGRIISSIKKTSSAPKPTAPTAPAPAQIVNPDLERLFKALTGQVVPAAVPVKPPAPPPPPVPVVKARPAKPVPAAPVPRRAQSLQSVSRVKTARNVKRLSQNWVNASLNLGGAGSPAGKSAATRAARAEVMQMLHNSSGIKKAVLLREILGPPVSIRT